MDLGAKIKARRIELKLSLTDVARRLDVAPSTILRWESGYTKNISLSVMNELAKVLKVDTSFFIDSNYQVPEVDEFYFAIQGISELDKEIIILIQKLPIKEKIKLYNTLNNESSNL